MYKLIINLKTYCEAVDRGAVEIARDCKELESEALKRNVEIILVPTYFDIKECVNEGVKVYSQHVDPFDYGSHTGYVIPKELADIGVEGTLLNHSEHQLEENVIKESTEFAKNANLEVCICARDDETVEKIKKFSPDFIAVEPQELIGGDISISKARPELIENSKKAAGDVSLLVGAGVKNSEDIKIALEKGAEGVLVASGVAKNDNHKDSIMELLKGFD